MVKVAGRWEFGWNTPIAERDLWVMPVDDFGVDGWIMTPVSGIFEPRVQEVDSIETAVEANPGLVPVYVTERGREELSSFKHPENALYVFGSSGPAFVVPESAISIRIKTVRDKGMLWAQQALCIVLYDRMIKCL